MQESCVVLIILLRITTLLSLRLFFFLSPSCSSQTAPPSWTVSQGSAQEEEEEEVGGEHQGLTPRIRGPRNACMSPTSPSASETLTYDKCLGCVDQSRPAVLICHFEKRCCWGKKKKKRNWRQHSDVSPWMSLKCGAVEGKRGTLLFVTVQSCCHHVATNNTSLVMLVQPFPPFFSPIFSNLAKSSMLRSFSTKEDPR